MTIEPAVIESISYFHGIKTGDHETSHKLYVRVWRAEDKIQDEYDTNDIQALVYSQKHWTSSSLAKALLQLSRVNAVEVKDAFGNGVVLYKEWP